MVMMFPTCEHGITTFRDISERVSVAQHGSNPEHRLVLPEREMMEPRDPDYGIKKLFEWVSAIHERNGDPLPQWLTVNDAGEVLG